MEVNKVTKRSDERYGDARMWRKRTRKKKEKKKDIPLEETRRYVQLRKRNTMV